MQICFAQRLILRTLGRKEKEQRPQENRWWRRLFRLPRSRENGWNASGNLHYYIFVRD